MEFREHIVNFEKYCPLCKFAQTDENDEPCRECISIPARVDSRKPEKFEEK